MRNGEEVIKNRNRLVYIEPNELPNIIRNNDFNGNKNITWQPEDLNMYVDLVVCLPKRICTDNVNTFKDVEFNKEEGKVSLFRGKSYGMNKNYLSTSYSDISYTNMIQDESTNIEGLGITSIDINFDAHFYPQVTINFVDVRGSGLMSGSEEKYRREQMAKSTGSNRIQDINEFFESFFHFPYPKFLLTVKGFYGTKVTYVLAVDKHNISLDMTGDFHMSVSFIGYMYGLYTDIPMKYLLIAPYIGLNNGETVNKTWQNLVNEGVYYTYEKTQMPTFVEYLGNYSRIAENIGTILSDTEVATFNENNRKIEELKKENGEINSVLERVTNNGDVVSMPHVNDSKYNYWFVSNISVYNDILNDLKNKSGITYKSLSKVYDSVDTTNDVYSNGVLNDFTTTTIDDNEKKRIISGLNTYKTEVINKPYCIIYFSQKIQDNNAEIERLNEDVNVQNVKKVISDSYASILGIKPTLRNFFRMIFCHLDCFMRQLYSRVLTNSNRVTKTFTDFFSDADNVLKMCDVKATNAGVNRILPVFTGFFKSKGGSNGLLEYVYPNYENLNFKDGQILDETKFCEDLLTSATFTGLRVDNLSDVISEIEEDGVTYSSNFNKIHPYDFLLTDNPYEAVKNCINDSDSEKAFKELCQKVYIRLHDRSDCISGDNKKYIENESKNIINTFDLSALKNILKNVDKQKLINEVVQQTSGQSEVFGYIDFTDEPLSNYNGTTIIPVNGRDGDTNFEDMNFLNADSLMNSDLYVDIKNFVGNLDSDDKKFKHNALSNEGRVRFAKYVEESGKWKYMHWGDMLRSNDTYRIIDFAKISMDGTIFEAVPSDYIFHKYRSKYKESLYLEFLGGLLGIRLGQKDKLNISNNVYSLPKSWYLFFGGILWAYRQLISNICQYDKQNDNVYLLDLFEDMAIFVSGNHKKITRDDYIKRNGLLYGEQVFKFLDDDYSYNENKSCSYFEYFNGHNISRKENNIYRNFLEFLFQFGFGNIDEKLFNSYPNNGSFKKDVNKLVDILKKFYKEHDEICQPEQDFLNWCSDNSEIFKKDSDDYYIFNDDCYDKSVKVEYSHNGQIKFFNVLTQSLHDKIMNLLDEKCYLVTVNTNQNQKVGDSDIIDALNGLFDNLSEQLLNDDTNSINFNDEGDEVSHLMQEKLSIYLTLKSTYDKWLASYPNSKSFQLDTIDKELAYINKRYYSINEKDGITSNEYGEFGNFVFVDQFFRDIGDKFFMDPKTLTTLILRCANSDNKMSIYEFMAKLCEDNKLMMIALPTYNILNNIKSIVNIFKPNETYSEENSSMMNNYYGGTYVVMYASQSSKALDYASTQSIDFNGDGFDLADTTGQITDTASLLFEENNSDNDTRGLLVPAFGVTFGMQNQNYFKNMTISNEAPVTTEYSISNKLQLAQGGAHGDVMNPLAIGQNIYAIYSNYSYNTSIEMMGCANIMPLMYYQLNNVPMFKGAYMIFNVKHNITPGNMTTSFTGQRVSKYVYPLLSDNYMDLTEIMKRLNKYGESAGISYNRGEVINSGTNNVVCFENVNLNKIKNAVKETISVTKNNVKITPNTNFESKGACLEAVGKMLNYVFQDNIKQGIFGATGNNCLLAGNVMIKKTDELCPMQAIGFKEQLFIDVDKTEKERNEMLEGNLNVCDVAVMYNGNHDIGNGHAGHICVWTGNEWVSDFNQSTYGNDPYVYRGVNKRPIRIFRYVGCADAQRSKITDTTIKQQSSSNITDEQKNTAKQIQTALLGGVNGKNFTEAQIIGIISALMQESQLKPTAVSEIGIEKGTFDSGIAQWVIQSHRQDRVISCMKKTNYEVASKDNPRVFGNIPLGEQIYGFVRDLIEKSNSGLTYNIIKGQTTAEDACAYFTALYESGKTSKNLADEYIKSSEGKESIRLHSQYIDKVRQMLA